MKAKMKRMATLASASAAVLCALPAYYYVANLAGAPLPAYATHLVGTWQAEDEHGDACVLRFNRFNMVSVETPDVRQKGPVEWSEQSFTAGPLPVLSFLGESKTFKVTHWPASTADVLAVDGLNYRKVK